MNLRERIADWISGGALTFHKNGWARSIAIGQERDREIAQAKFDRGVLEYDNRNGWANSDRFKSALNAIAACETPSANGTVRRMANIAREALK